MPRMINWRDFSYGGGMCERVLTVVAVTVAARKREFGLSPFVVRLGIGVQVVI